MAEQKKIDVVIPAYKPGEKFQKLIKMLQKQTYPIHEILIMNTEKAYFPEASVAGLPNVRVEHLTRAEFDHGGTRDKAAGLLSFYDPGRGAGRYLPGGKARRGL